MRNSLLCQFFIFPIGWKNITINVWFYSKTNKYSVNVVGYFKTCVVFIGGVLFFSNNLDYKNGTGVTLTLVGVFLYTFVPKDNKPAPAQQAKEAEPVKPEERV
jgi:hypothetical protein